MTRKRFMKLMMGKGVHRNTARMIVQTIREKKETEDRMLHHIKTGEQILIAQERTILETLKVKMALEIIVAKLETQDYMEASNI